MAQETEKEQLRPRLINDIQFICFVTSLNEMINYLLGFKYVYVGFCVIALWFMHIDNLKIVVPVGVSAKTPYPKHTTWNTMQQ